MSITMHTQMKQFARVQAKDALKFSQPSSPAGLNEMCERTFHSPSHVVPMCAYRRLFDMGQNK